MLKLEKLVSRLFLLSSGEMGSCCLLDASPCSFSGVGHIPSCSYRSKKLELVGGARSDMLVDLERGKITAPELERGRMTAPEFDLESMEDSDPDASGMVYVGAGETPGAEVGVGGNGDVGGGVKEVPDGDDDRGRFKGAVTGKYDGFGGNNGGLSMAAGVGG